MTTINSNNGDGQTSPTYDNYGQRPEDDKKLFVGKICFSFYYNNKDFFLYQAV